MVDRGGVDFALDWLIYRLVVRSRMAKSDSFFIRARTEVTGTTFNQSTIDLGAFVDALGKSVLRLHNIAVRYGTALEQPVCGANVDESVAFQLTTQSQSTLVGMTDKSLIASGRLYVSADGGGVTAVLNDTMDLSPQHWSNGYLVGVENIYLGVDCSNATDVVSEVSIVLEATVETLSQNAAMALALSQN